MRKLLLLSMRVVGCATDESEAASALYKAGFTNVQTGNVTFWGCSEEDKMGRAFTATNPSGLLVRGTVCCGIFKGCTIRF